MSKFTEEQIEELRAYWTEMTSEQQPALAPRHDAARVYAVAYDCAVRGGSGPTAARAQAQAATHDFLNVLKDRSDA
jgi:hypothetical protein